MAIRSVHFDALIPSMHMFHLLRRMVAAFITTIA